MELQHPESVHGTGLPPCGPPRRTASRSPSSHPARPPRPPAAGSGPPPADGGAERELGVSLYRLRLENGLSLRALAQRMGYSAHSVIADIEKGRRIPSEALVHSYEAYFGVADGALRLLRRRAMAERADRLAARLASGAPGREPPPAAGPGERPPAPDRTGAPPAGAGESVPDVLGRLVTAVLSEARQAIGRWRR